MPRYVQACEDQRWHLDLQHRETGERKCVPYHCRSWRHRGACAKSRAGDDARRIRDGFLRYGKPMAFLVLTFNPAEHRGGVPMAYRAIVVCWQKLYQRMTRRWGKAPYVLLVEEHKNQWPHINVLLGGHVGAEVERGRWREIRREIKQMATATGFGMVLWVDKRAATPTLPGYIAKYATKADQAPVHAPRKFRRLRATRGFLGAPKPSGETYTGELVTDAEGRRQDFELQRERARDARRRVSESESAAAEFLRAVEQRRRDYLAALARGEVDGSEIGFVRDDPDTWPDEWVVPVTASRW